MDTYCAEALPLENRTAGGLALAHRLAGIHWPAPAVVLALPRGGVPVAKAISATLHLPLEVLVVRKIRHPRDREFAIGAVAAGGFVVRNCGPASGIPGEQFDKLAAAGRAEVEHKESLYRSGRGPLSLAGKTVILVDDGVATGATMRAALGAARAMGAAHLVAAIPVGERHAVKELEKFADEVVCLYCPEPFQSVGFHYSKFSQLDEVETCALLQNAA